MKDILKKKERKNAVIEKLLISCLNHAKRSGAKSMYFFNEDAFTQELVVKVGFDCKTVAHFTTSIWTVNKERTKALMVYHNIYNSWSWIGGHADGEENLGEVAIRELQEETGVKNARLVSDEILSIETLTVDGHIKKGKYVPCHLHFNVTYLAEADETEVLIVNEDENQAVKWFTFEDALEASTEPWMVEYVYKKLIEKSR